MENNRKFQNFDKEKTISSMIYAVIDTNVLVSALIIHNSEAATTKVVRLLMNQDFIPMYNADIIAEYQDVLRS